MTPFCHFIASVSAVLLLFYLFLVGQYSTLISPTGQIPVVCLLGNDSEAEFISSIALFFVLLDLAEFIEEALATNSPGLCFSLFRIGDS